MYSSANCLCRDRPLINSDIEDCFCKKDVVAASDPLSQAWSYIVRVEENPDLKESSDLKARATELFQQLADAGCIKAMNSLAFKMEKGSGVRKDCRQAHKVKLLSNNYMQIGYCGVPCIPVTVQTTTSI